MCVKNWLERLKSLGLCSIFNDKILIYDTFKNLPALAFLPDSDNDGKFTEMLTTFKEIKYEFEGHVNVISKSTLMSMRQFFDYVYENYTKDGATYKRTGIARNESGSKQPIFVKGFI